VGFIDIGVLVDDGIARVVPDELNRHVQLILPHAVAQGGHLRPAGDGVRPSKQEICVLTGSGRGIRSMVMV
jgi:hypothetical protein